MLGRQGNTGNTYQIKCNKDTPCNGANGYYPLDKYSGDSTFGRQGQTRNYGFTLAGSAEFKYDAGKADVFNFLGDDDMWIFIDGKLVVDLGGVHEAVKEDLNIQRYGDSLKWEDGTMHVINFFYAERQTAEANMTLTLAITNLTPSQFGAPEIRKAETSVGVSGKPDTTLLYVSTQIDMNIINNYRDSANYGFPIVVFTNGPTGPIYGYKIETFKYTGTRDASGYIYEMTGYVCKDPSCNETQSLVSGDSLSFNVKIGDFENLPISNRGFALGNNEDHKYIRNPLGNAQATKLSWGMNTSKRETLVLKPKTTDTKPVKPIFGPKDGNMVGVGSAEPDKTVPKGAGGAIGTYIPKAMGNPPSVTQVWDPKANEGKGGLVNPNRDIDGAEDGGTIHGFGTVGKQIPPQRAGELILTAYPNAFPSATGEAIPKGYDTYKDWEDAYKEGKGEAAFFGLPPSAENATLGEWWGLADPTDPARGGGYQFVKNGFPNESSTKGNIKIAPTRCTSLLNEDPDAKAGEKANINCLNFSMPAQQPFQLAVTVYDQLGNFVTQYREIVTEQEFRNVTQAPNYVPANQESVKNSTSDCQAPTSNNYGKESTITTNGLVNVNVNIYPFSSTGRRFGNGVYIVKIDRVDIPFSGCQLLNGQPSFNYMPFVRSHSEQKFGWMRAEYKDKK
jgi:fibro-slime domain-containing protein